MKAWFAFFGTDLPQFGIFSGPSWRMASSISLFPQAEELGVAGFLPLLLSLVGKAESGIFHRITMTSMTGAWYLPITKFEAIIVGLVILEIFVLRYLLILPLDYTKWIEEGILLQTAVLKRKKRWTSSDHQEARESKQLTETMLTVLHRLDTESCLMKSLCELEILLHDQKQKPEAEAQCTLIEFPSQIKSTLLILEKIEVPDSQENEMMSQFKKSVMHGQKIWQGRNLFSSFSQNCTNFYPTCSLNQAEIVANLHPYFTVLSSSEEKSQ